MVLLLKILDEPRLINHSWWAINDNEGGRLTSLSVTHYEPCNSDGTGIDIESFTGNAQNIISFSITNKR